MTVPQGYYEQSYPPSLWAPAPPVAAAAPAEPAAEPVAETGRQVASSSPPPELLVAAGTPGTYDLGQRARNVTELRERATPSPRTPWLAGQYVPVGTSGKRAHWTGEDWRSGESPGYGPASEGPAGVVFPGTDDSPEDLHR